MDFKKESQTSSNLFKEAKKACREKQYKKMWHYLNQCIVWNKYSGVYKRA